MKHLISILLENESGALSRVVGLFSQRGYNIESLTVAPTEDSTLSRITIVTDGDNSEIEQITKQLHKLVDVLKVCDLADSTYVEREIMLIKCRASTIDVRTELMHLADIFRGQIVDVTSDLYVIQLVGDTEKLDAFIEIVGKSAGILEVVRSGVCGIARGERALRA
ncbi:MAG: acetolactate synthase small subunit [Succinivibrionaceae bacterium]|nr:acetolactate synthase small subunit [Succinivibrionaceae bacterium]MCI6198981.1 acetolactate synthase small subunit [Pseudomonadota bacterium]MBQ5527374.1 acetolactate synthase small subunit [Succinivibrionaceae bacterium]MDD6546611.1 acetolactate synthase small subunit [Pseudomonadota bacterium]MDY3144190.1 acetolactate synthase small subunit [Succinivibrionaceae bacterium]